MRMRWRRCLSIVLIAAVLLVNFGSAGTAYASEIDNAGEEQVTESANEASAESGEGSQQGDGLTEGAEKGDEDADSVEPGEADNNDEGKQEGDAAEGQDAAETDGSGKSDDDAIVEEAGGEGSDAEEGTAEEAAGEDASGEEADAIETPAEGESVPEGKELTEGADKKQEADKKGATRASADELGIDGRGGLVIMKQIQGIPEGEYRTKFKIRLWTDTAPISDFTIESAGETYVTDENGEFTYEMVVTVNGTQGSNGVGFTVPAPCNYSVEEVECDSPLAVSTEKTADTGTTVVNQGTTTNWYAKRGRLEVTAIVRSYATDYVEYAPIAEHTIELTYNGEPLSGTFPMEGALDGATSLTFDENGKATVAVKMARPEDGVDPVTVHGIPQGTTIKVSMTDPIKAYLAYVPDRSTTLWSPLYQADCLNGTGNYYVSGDQYFYYYDSTGKVPEIRYYFLNRADPDVYLTDTKMSYTYLDDGTKLYYFDCNGSEHEITVKSGERVVCACFPWYSTDGIGVRYTPVANVRINNIYGYVRPIDGVMDSYTSWSGSLQKRGVLFVAADAYGIETVHKTDRNSEAVDSTFCLTNSTSSNKKKYSFIHHDTYEYNGTEYSNVYEVNLDEGLKDFDSDDADTFIKTDENGDFNIMYPRPLDNSIGANREGIGNTTSGELEGGYLYEVECDNDHYFGQEYWQLSGIHERIRYDGNVTYDGQPYYMHRYMHYVVDPSAFDYSKLDLGEVDDGVVYIGEKDAVNGSFPYVEKQVASTGSYSYDADPDQKFTFEVYYEGELVKTFQLGAGESYHLSPSNIPTISQNTLYKHTIKEKPADGWITTLAPNSSRWRSSDGGYYFGASYNVSTEQDLVIVNRRQSRELTIQKSVQDAPADEEVTTRFKVTLWDETEDGSKVPIKNFETTVGDETITGNESGEFFVDVVTNGADAASKTISVPYNCHYSIEEVSCSLEGAESVSKTNEQGVMEANVESAWKNAVLNSLSISKTYDDNGTNVGFYKTDYTDETYFGMLVNIWDVPEWARSLATVEGYFTIVGSLGSMRDISVYFGDKQTGSLESAFNGTDHAGIIVWVKDGETVKIDNLPAGASYNVNEVCWTSGTWQKNPGQVFDITYENREGTLANEDVGVSVLNKQKVVNYIFTKSIQGFSRNDDDEVFYYLFDIPAAHTYTYDTYTLKYSDHDGNVHEAKLVPNRYGNYYYCLLPIKNGERISITVPTWGWFNMSLFREYVLKDEYWGQMTEADVISQWEAADGYNAPECLQEVRDSGYYYRVETRNYGSSAILQDMETGFINHRRSIPITVTKVFQLMTGNPKASFKLAIWDGSGDHKIPLSGLNIGVGTTDDNGEVTFELASGETAVIPLPEGCYYRIEELDSSDEFEFRFHTKNNTRVYDRVDTGRVRTSDQYYYSNIQKRTIEFNKLDVLGEHVPGAVLQVLDDKGNVLKEWTSGESSGTVDLIPNITVEGVSAPSNYVLHEKETPEGYAAAADIEFRVIVQKNSETDGYETLLLVTGSDGGVRPADSVDMVDEYLPHDIVVSKTDINGDEIEGAQLSITGTETGGKEIDEITWVSGADGTDETTGKIKPHTVSLKPGTYTMHESAVPDGSVYVAAADITFTVDTEGNITIDGSDVEKITMVDEYAPQDVRVKKTDIADGEELEGAHIQVIDSEGNVVEEWDSATEAHVVEGLNVGEEYTLKETVAPEGYTIAAETTFTIDKTGAVTSTGTTTTDEDGNTVLLVEDAKTSVRVSKTDIADREELEGATIRILDSEGKVVEEWVSTKEAHVVEGLKTGQEYTLKETVAPDGYTIAAETTFTIDETGAVTTTGSSTTDEEGNTVLLVNDAKTRVEVSKVDIADGEELEGAHIQILDGEGIVVEEWVSTKEAHVVEGLKTGVNYTLKETVAPDGYTIAAETAFLINENGEVESDTTKISDGVLLVEDAMTVVRVSKVDIADGEELEGAHIQVLDSEGNVVEEWDSTTEAHVVEGLNTGEEYTLKETVAPEGYTIATETTFTIDENGEVTTTGTTTTDEEGNTVLLVEDAKTSVRVSKTDIADGEELEGAHIQVLDSEGNVVEEWDSTTEAHVVEGLKTGEEYTLKETVAPEGYTIATETTFTIDETGKVTSTGTTTTDEEGNAVLLVEDSKTHIEVSKVDIATGEELEGAHIQILDSEGNVVEEWDSTTEAHVVEDLKTGEEYTLKETVAPEGYLIAAETTFTIDETGKVTTSGTTTTDEEGNTVLLVEDAKASVRVSKVDIADGEELEGAHIQVLDSKGNVVEEWDSTTEGQVVEGLNTGEEYTLKETVAPEGYTIASETTFTIDETGEVTTGGTITTDEEGNTVLLVEDAKTSVRVSKTDIADGEELEGAHIQILDSEGNVVEEWDSTTEAHVVEGLKTGEEYTLKETVAPEGYTIATETTFTIDETGEVTSTGTTTTDEEGNTVLLVEDSKTHIEVSKVDIATGEELEGAHIQILDSEGNVVEEWDSTTETHVVEGLKTGEEYTLRETVAPEGYQVTTDTTFTIDETGKVTSTGTTTTDEEGNTILLVEDVREGETGIVLNGEKVLQGGSLKVDQFTFELKDENGDTVSEAKNDADGNFTFDRLAYKLADLDGEKEKVFTYTVSEVKGSDADITYDENVITVKVTVTDNGDGTITAAADKSRSEIKFVNKVKEKKSSKTSTTPGKKKGGRTGDEAPLGILFGGLGVGAAGLIALLVYRRKRNSEQ